MCALARAFRGSHTQRENEAASKVLRIFHPPPTLSTLPQKGRKCSPAEDVQRVAAFPSCTGTDICSQAFPEEFFVQSIVNNFQDVGDDEAEYGDQVSHLKCLQHDNHPVVSCMGGCGRSKMDFQCWTLSTSVSERAFGEFACGFTWKISALFSNVINYSMRVWSVFNVPCV